MKTKAIVLTAAALSVAMLTACGERPADDNAVGADATTADAPAAASANPDAMNPGGIMPADAPAGAMTESDALGVVVAVNEHEIAAAEQARDKKVAAPVREYADMMHKEHTTNLEQTRALEGSSGVTIGTGPEVASLRTQKETARNEMANLEGNEYERAYIDAMVRDHQEVLTMLDQRLIPAAQNAAIKQHLQMTRDAVAKHLERARELQGQAGGEGSTTNDAGTPPAEGDQTPPAQ
jgi:putative membrane protein